METHCTLLHLPHYRLRQNNWNQTPVVLSYYQSAILRHDRQPLPKEPSSCHDQQLPPNTHPWLAFTFHSHRHTTSYHVAMPLHHPPLQHFPRIPSSSDVTFHCIDWYCPSTPHQDHPPRPPAPLYCKNQPNLKTGAWHRHNNSNPSPIWLAPHVSQKLQKHQVLSTPGYSLLSRWWVDSRTSSFCTHTETSPRNSSYLRLLAPHQ